MNPALPTRLAIILSAVCLVTQGRPAASFQGDARPRVYVTVATAAAAPVTGLLAEDFFVRIDDAPQEILSAGPAVEPPSIVLLTDRLGATSDYRPPDVQRALGSFVKGIRAGHQDARFALTTIDGTVSAVVPFSAPFSSLERALGRLAAMGGDAPLIDGLADACRTAGRAPTDRRVIFLVFGSYRPDRSNPRSDDAGQDCRRSGASLWTIEARASDGRNYANPAREMLVDQTSQWSGGMHQMVPTATALDDMSTRMAALISSQYVITYAPGRGTAKSRLTVGVKRTGVFIMAPMWLAR